MAHNFRSKANWEENWWFLKSGERDLQVKKTKNRRWWVLLFPFFMIFRQSANFAGAFALRPATRRRKKTRRLRRRAPGGARKVCPPSKMIKKGKEAPTTDNQRPAPLARLGETICRATSLATKMKPANPQISHKSVRTHKVDLFL